MLLRIFKFSKNHSREVKYFLALAIGFPLNRVS